MAASVGGLVLAASLAPWLHITQVAAAEPVAACAAKGLREDAECAASEAQEGEEVGLAQLRALVRPPPTSANDLQSCLRGAGLSALFPGDGGFQQSRRLHNYRVEHLVTPNATVSVSRPEEVQAAVRCARAATLPVYGASGMNAYEAFCTKGCLLVLTAGLKRRDVDAAARTAVLGPGLTNGEMYYYLAKAPGGPFALPSGTTAGVGLGGIALGGGKGYLTRHAGLLSDRIYAVDVVLWNGSLAHASEEENPDLLWICRGGGGTQVPGIVVAFYFQLIDAPSSVCAFQLTWDLSHSKGVVASWQKHMVMSADNRLHVRLEPNQFGNRKVALAGWLVGGSCDEAKALLQPALAELPWAEGGWRDGSWLDTVKSSSGMCEWCKNADGVDMSPGQCLPDEALVDASGSNPNNCGYGMGYDAPTKHRGLVLPKLLDDAGIDKLVELFSNPPRGGNNAPEYPYRGFYLQIDPTNGKAAEVAANATAYPWRSQEGVTLQLLVKFPGSVRSDQEWEGFSYKVIEELLPWSGGGHGHGYINYLDRHYPGDPDNLVLDEYWGPNSATLLRILQSFQEPDPVSHCYWTLSVSSNCSMDVSN